ncbi:GMP synthase [glutamine-hydrolyzing], putative [Plasmodium ovale]|uniref:GMP synthase [glutamine-hydrolyzing] n=2 Tax=Plasmodium ovale TaxID=36330 RepID=A0A1A8W4J4_PLAOA|nr:GMP synthetase, putative [Plasmodium ovale curtisi]SBS87850.1 GMP synthetase, putative [Plasmodium ovale curtisi]SCP04116.1 GMP synthase [glutamine-hydrolyzing], putative [Plasmodium ovale]
MEGGEYDKILVLNFGSQYFHLIIKRLNNIKIFSETRDYNVDLDEVKDMNVKGVILSGGPRSVFEKDAPHLKNEVLEYFLKNKIPIFAICYGMQEIAVQMKGKVNKSKNSEHGCTEVSIITNEHINDIKYKNYKLLEKNEKCILFDDIKKEKSTTVWMNHTDEVTEIPKNFYIVNSSEDCLICAMYSKEYNIYGVQYHPEVYESVDGDKIFHNFVYKICKCTKMFDPIKYHENEFSLIKKYANDHFVIAAMSGGIDSTVAAAYTYKIFKERFFGIFIDNGLLRKNEGDKVYAFLKNIFPDMNLTKIDASEIFLNNLKGIIDPEKKRKIIGKLFIDEFEKAVKNINIDINKTYLLQGTLYPDIIESKCSKNLSDTIKTHHNVGGLPKNLKFKLFEPFKFLFKDDIKKLSQELGLPNEITNRHPFPGPGLAIRIIGEVNKEKLDILRQVDDIFINDLRYYNLYDKISQAFAVLLSTKSVGVRGDARSYDYICALRAVKTSSFMTASWYQIPYDILEKISTHILSEVKNVNRILYDISSKPPSTIEFE